MPPTAPEHVPVWVRMRPPLPHEDGEGTQLWECSPGPTIGKVARASHAGQAAEVVFEGHVFGPCHTATDLYTADMEAGVESVCASLHPGQGLAHTPYSCALMVYGNQSSGKTYTLLGDGVDGGGHDSRVAGEALHADAAGGDGAGSKGTECDPGLAHYCLNTLFRGIDELKQQVGGEHGVDKDGGEAKISVAVSVCELYNEVCSDLLQPSRVRLALVDDPLLGVKVCVWGLGFRV